MMAIDQILQEHFWRLVETTIPIGLFLLKNRWSAKKEQDRRHAENQKKLDDLVIERKFLPAHKHDEKSGTLTVDGISYVPKIS